MGDGVGRGEEGEWGRARGNGSGVCVCVGRGTWGVAVWVGGVGGRVGEFARYYQPYHSCQLHRI